MRDLSIFKGIKQLRNFRLADRNGVWHVYKEADSAFEFVGKLRQKNRESNIKLFERIMDSF